MFIGDPPGNYDRILDFSTAVTGCLVFVPTAGLLNDPPGPCVTTPDPTPTESTSTAFDESLGVGNLKRSRTS